MQITFDIETRSCADLRDIGVYKYAEDASTEILCAAYKVDDQPTKVAKLSSADTVTEVDGSLEELLALMAKADHIHAHNAGFERTLWHYVMYKRRGYPDVPISKWRCSMAVAAAHALPLGLEAVGQALGLRQQKDLAGGAIMKKFCAPVRSGAWYEETDNFEPKDWVTLYEYCKQDVETEHELIKSIRPLRPFEQRVWEVDQKINDRGVSVAHDEAKRLQAHVRAAEAKYDAEIVELTGGKIQSARQLKVGSDWLKEHGMPTDELTKGKVAELLKETSIDPKAKRFLEIRQSVGLTSTGKIDAMVAAANSDSRIRGCFMYHAATTGRWGGRLIQPQNFPRNCFKEIKEIQDVAAQPTEAVEAKYGCPIKAASRCLRGLLRPPAGKVFVGGDYSSIEARITAWLAKEKWVLDEFVSGRDMYKVAAAKIFNIAYEAVSKDQRQLGKVAELALGYQGWLGAFKNMAAAYGMEIPDEQAKPIILAWREAHPATVRLWDSVEQAAFRAVDEGKTFEVGPVMFGAKDNFLWCRLPSGRLLAYHRPHITEVTRPQGVRKAIGFYAVDSYTKKYSLQTTYGGSLVENIVQAIARDILAEALVRLDMFGYDPVLHIHDEIICEAENPDLEEFQRLMITLPKWAKGIPLAAGCEISEMYTKD